MKKMMALMVCLSILGFAGVATAGFVPVLTFEDLYPGHNNFVAIPSGYHGFTWGPDAWYMTKNFYPGTGYYYGTLGNVSLFTAYYHPIYLSNSNNIFDFNGAYITAAYDTNEDVVVEGWLKGNLKYSTTITTHNDKAYWFSFNFTDIDTLWFRPQGTQIVIDNINSPVPLPGAIWFLGSGLLGLAGWRGLRKS